MNCPKCKSSQNVKDGIVGGRQRRKCKQCSYRYTVERKSNVKTPATRRLALELYLEGLPLRAVGDILKISYGTVYVWVKELESKASLPRREIPVDMVELDELLNYVISKKTVSKHGLLLIDLEKNISVLSVVSPVDKLEI
jgi:transposase-like protein